MRKPSFALTRTVKAIVLATLLPCEGWSATIDFESLADGDAITN